MPRTEEWLKNSGFATIDSEQRVKAYPKQGLLRIEPRGVRPADRDHAGLDRPGAAGRRHEVERGTTCHRATVEQTDKA
ncbi:hypothetical protein ACFY5F_49030 [Streptomyces sp. NPDC013161]|uniref:hypothetical protein n=1 Tax=Streptomyces sp. NPDC013161 TaxID=3364862 RepID=UPI0036972275